MKALCILLISMCYFVHSQPDCSYILDDERDGHYNLSAIVGKELRLSDGFATYKTTICKNTYDDCGTCSGPAGFCQETDFWADCIGVFTLVRGFQNVVELYYENGDWGSYGRIRLLCDPNVDEIDGLQPVDTNYKLMTARSKHACLVTTVNDCSFIRDSGGVGHYDLSAIVGKELRLQDSFSTYKTTICRNTYFDCGNCGGPAGFCQSTEFWIDCIGVFTRAIGSQNVVELYYENGDWGAYGKIKLLCDPNVDDIDGLQPNGTNYKIMTARSKHACLAKNCNSTSCGDCTSSQYCSWCLDNLSCGDRNSTMTCRNFINDPVFCPSTCNIHNTCDSCTNGNCAWCLGKDGNVCVPHDNVSQCAGVVRDPSYCPK